MKIDRKQLISAILALCVLIGCVALLIIRGFQIRFAVSAALYVATALVIGWVGGRIDRKVRILR